MRSKPVFLLVAAVLTVAATAQDLPESLRAMADTEREFARAATVKGVRDSFLEFFADDAIALAPKPVSAKDRLRKQPSRPFSEYGIIWEPRAGEVSASGEIGWLTGPATFTSGEQAKPTGYGCYLSIWRTQPDGRWRVFIDIGASAPEPVTFAPGFTRMMLDQPYRGRESAEVATTRLLESDRTLNEQIAAAGAGKAYGGVLTAKSRLHRQGRVPMVGIEAIVSWFAGLEGRLTAETGSAEAARSGDFGYSYGVYRRDGTKPESGPYARVWSRDASGRWWLMADVAHPAP